MIIAVRKEEPKDYHRVEVITKQAFSYPGRIERGKIGCPFEHWMVHELRQRDGILPLSLVAEANRCIVGHIICSRATVVKGESTEEVLNLGPVSVLPAYQRKGVGKALINAMLARAKELGFGAILFCGRPEYYPQFGFQEASQFNITDCEGYNFPAFMGMELIPGYLSRFAGGRFYESDIFDDALNAERAKEFNTHFVDDFSEASM